MWDCSTRLPSLLVPTQEVKLKFILLWFPQALNGFSIMFYHSSDLTQQKGGQNTRTSKYTSHSLPTSPKSSVHIIPCFKGLFFVCAHVLCMQWAWGEYEKAGETLFRLILCSSWLFFILVFFLTFLNYTYTSSFFLVQGLKTYHHPFWSLS